MKTICLGDGVQATLIKNSNFKTAAIAVSFYLTPSEDELSSLALALELMKSGCTEFPSRRLINLKLGMLFGASVSTSVQKFSDNFEYRITMTFPDGKYTGSENTAVEAADMLKSLIFERYFSGCSYPDNDASRTRRLICETISGEINDKRVYAMNKTISLLCADEPFGYNKYGTYEQAENVTENDIRNAFDRLIKNAFINITVIGETPSESLCNDFAKLFDKAGRDYIPLANDKTRSAGEVERITEYMDVAQSKLCIGLRSENGGGDSLTAATLVMCDIFGGGTYSKLFLNVRERQSLCYYCSAFARRRKGVIMVTSGVEFANVEKAESEILNQFADMQAGKFEDEDIRKSKLSLTEYFKSLSDELPSLLNNCCVNAPYSDAASPEEMCEFIKNVTREDIIRAAASFDTGIIYKLLPKEEK